MELIKDYTNGKTFKVSFMGKREIIPEKVVTIETYSGSHGRYYRRLEGIRFWEDEEGIRYWSIGAPTIGRFEYRYDGKWLYIAKTIKLRVLEIHPGRFMYKSRIFDNIEDVVAGYYLFTQATRTDKDMIYLLGKRQMNGGLVKLNF